MYPNTSNLLNANAGSVFQNQTARPPFEPGPFDRTMDQRTALTSNPLAQNGVGEGPGIAGSPVGLSQSYATGKTSGGFQPNSLDRPSTAPAPASAARFTNQNKPSSMPTKTLDEMRKQLGG